MPCKCDENTTFAVYNPPVVINMSKRILLLFAMTVMLSVSAPAVCPPSDSLVSVTDTALHVHKPRPWMAAAEVAGINIGILAFDRFILNEEFAHVTMKTLRRNIKLSHWFWDSDHMYTNLMSHPYHGSLYYNAARSNGMSYAVSTLYSTVGSLMWEIGGENELLSVNDFLSTSTLLLPISPPTIHEQRSRASVPCCGKASEHTPATLPCCPTAAYQGP